MLRKLASEVRPQAILQNPVTVKELRGRMRGRRAFVILTVYLLAMSLFVTLIYLLYAAATSSSPGAGNRQAGKVVFTSILAVQVFLVTLIGPAFTSAAISGEKERQTYELLRTTLLSSRSLVMGKLVSALGYVFLLIVASIPFQSLAFLLGGISTLELVLSQLVIAASAVAFAMVGLYFSSVMRSTLASTVVTFVIALLFTAGIPFLAMILASVMGPLFFGASTPSWPVIQLLIFLGLALASTNLPAALVVGDLVLVEEDALFFFTTVVDGHTVQMFSPWWTYIVFCVLLSLILFVMTVRRVKRIPER